MLFKTCKPISDNDKMDKESVATLKTRNSMETKIENNKLEVKQCLVI